MANTNSKFATIALAGKQYLVSVGDKILSNRITAKEGEELQVKDLLSGEIIGIKVLAHKLGKKISGLKFHSKVRYTRRYGHRQTQSQLEVIYFGKKDEVKKEIPAESIEKKTTKSKSVKTVKKAVKAVKATKVTKSKAQND